MTKITNKQTRPANAVVLTGAQVDISAHAASVAAFDVSAEAGDLALVFGVIFTAQTNYADFAVARKTWCAAYAGAMGCEHASASKRFQRLCAESGVAVPKATSESAVKKAAQRAAAKASTSGDALEGVGEAAAVSAIKAIKMELSSIEAHIVNLIRAAKFTLAAQAVADLAGASALV